MRLNDGDTVVCLHAPPNYPAALGALPDKVTVLQESTLPANATLVFVYTRAELDAQVAKMAPLLSPQALLWVAFRKVATKPNQDFNQDDVLACGQAAGLKSLTLISLDASWSAFKFKLA